MMPVNSDRHHFSIQFNKNRLTAASHIGIILTHETADHGRHTFIVHEAQEGPGQGRLQKG